MTQSMKIITPLRPSTVEKLESWLENLDDRVNMVELWPEQLVDQMMFDSALLRRTVGALNKAQAGKGVEILCVCKSPDENGDFEGTVAQRIQVLQQFLRFGGDWVDLDVGQNPPEYIAQLPPEKLWSSFHDFTSCDLSLLDAQYEVMKTFSPYLYKFAVNPQSEAELEAFIKWAESLKLERAIFAPMGEFGLEGREQLKGLNYAAFYALDEEHTTAVGQPTLADL